MNIKTIAVDFDGTLCEDKWPGIGAPNWEVIDYLRDEKIHGAAKLILWTCRTDGKLKDAIEWCKEHGLKFDAVNENLPERIAMFGADPRKIGADEYIEDRACTKFKLPFAVQTIGLDYIHSGKTIGVVLHKDDKTITVQLTDEGKHYLKIMDFK